MSDEKQLNTEVTGLNRLGIYVIGRKGVDKEGKPFTIYDEPFIIPELDCKGFVANMMNSPQSPYYFDYWDKFLYCVGYIDSNNMSVHVNTVPEVIATLASYVKPSLRKYQQTLQTLNFMPKGYYKMSEEQKKEIQEQLDNAIITYVEKFVIPEIDVSNIDKNSNEYKESLNKIISLSKSTN